CPTLRDAPVYGTIRDAMLHASTELGPGDLCSSCRESGRCDALRQSMEAIGTLDRTPVPRVRAVIARTAHGTAWDVQAGSRARQPHPLSDPSAAESLRPSLRTSWNPHGRPVVDPTAYIDRLASVVGAVTIKERVYVAPRVSLRADEGAPFYIGPET